MEIIQVLNLVAFMPSDKENSQLDCAMYYSDENICELQDPAAVTQFDGVECITENGIYFGTSDEREPKFCPAHYFANTGYVLEPVREVKNA